MREACTVWQMVTVTRSSVEEALRVAGQAGQRHGPRRLLTASAMACAFDLADPGEAPSRPWRGTQRITRSSTTMATSIQMSVRRCSGRRSSWLLLAEAQRSSDRASAAPASSSSSRARIPAARPGLGVVVAEDVEHAVDDEQGELVVDGARRARRLARPPPPGRSRRRRAAAGGRPGSAADDRDRAGAAPVRRRPRPARRRSGRPARRSAPPCP